MIIDIIAYKSNHLDIYARATIMQLITQMML